MVDFPRHILGIASIAKLHRTCKALVRKCLHNKKSPSSKEANREISEEDQQGLRKRSNTMNGSLHNNYRSSYNMSRNNNNIHLHDDDDDDEKTSPTSTSTKHKSGDNGCFPSIHFSCSPLMPRHSVSHRMLSRKSSTESSSTPSPPFLAKNMSRRSSNSIMFSNSSGVLKQPAIERRLECSLEDLCYGCQKKIKITRDVVKSTGIVVKEEELLTIKVKPGWKKGTKITFEGMGNEKPGVNAADITFVIAEKKHNVFRREGDDLELAVEISLLQALTGCELTIPLLGGKKMSLNIDDDVIYPGFETLVQGQGMPMGKDTESRGNLKVTFLVNFPKELTDKQRFDVLSILQD